MRCLAVLRLLSWRAAQNGLLRIGHMDRLNWDVLFYQDSAVSSFGVINNASNVNRRRIKKVDRKIS